MIAGLPKLIRFFFSIFLFCFIFFEINAEPIQDYSVKIQILDKITSNVAEVGIKTNNSIQFESKN